MKKLRIILLFSLIVFIRVYYITSNDIYKTKYQLKDTKLIGYINQYKTDGNQLKIELKAKEKVIVNYYFKTEKELKNFNYKLGDKIELQGEFKIPEHNRNFNSFNYNKYLKSKKIYYTFTASNIKKIEENKKISYKIKNLIIKRIKKINNNYLYTFILGDSSVLEKDVIKSYQSNGISHLFAVSGMHITLLTTVLLSILNKKLKNKYLINFIIFSFLIFYMFLTNFTPSVIRASLLFIILSLNKLFKFKLNPLIAILIILNIMLIINPYYIYNIGFILSFMVSISLIIFSKIINNYQNYFVKIFIISLISFLISIPIMINNYNQINLLSPIINIIFVPLISIFIFPFSLIVFFIPILKPILDIAINIEETLSLLISKIDILKLTLKTIDIKYFIIYYLIIILIINKLKDKKYHYLIIILIILFIHHNINYLNKYPVISMIDVGQGDSILIELPHNKGNILIDTGGIVSYGEDWQKRKEEYSIAKSNIIPYLKSRGIKKLDYLILTHGDYDHIGESTNLVNNFKVEKVIFNIGNYNELELYLIKVLKQKNINYYHNIETLNIGKDKIDFLNTREYDNENDNSSVVYTEINNVKMLFMGDAGIEKENDILKKYNLNNIDILKVGHHGSNTSSSKYFIDNIKPKTCLISVGKNNRFGHPNESVLGILEHCNIYRTDLNGGIEIKLRNNDYSIKTVNQ